MNLMKRLTALLLMLAMLLPTCVMAEELSDSMDMNLDEAVDVDEEDDGGLYFADEDVASVIEILDAELDTTVDPDNLELNKNLPDNVVNILLVGVDTRSTDLDEGYQQGDVQIVVSINTDDGSIKLTSVMRDLYVTIPGYKSKNRINVAYKRGGGELAMRTVNRLLELNIEHYVVINFYGLASIIDSLGGIDMEMTKQEAGAINTYLRKHPPKYDNQGKDYERQPLERKDGVQHLDGIQAVMYARVRSIDNDFERTSRQRKLLEALLGKVLDGGLDLNKLLDLLDVCLPYAHTNMSAMDMMTLAMDVLDSDILTRLENGDPLLEQQRVPLDETWKYYDADGASVIAFRTDKRLQENREAIHQFIYGAYYPAD